MNFLNTFPAKVIDNKDPQLKGRVKIRVKHLFEGVVDNDLPWAYPMIDINGGSATYGTGFIPEKDASIWVAIENMELLDPIFYISAFMWDDMSGSIFQQFEAVHGLKIGLSSQYPDVKFLRLKNGVTVGLSSSTTTPEIFMYHPTGSSIKFAKDGSIKVKDSLNTVSIVIQNNKIEINADTTSEIRTFGKWRHSGDIIATGEVVARSESTYISLGTHQHPTAATGSPSPPTPQAPSVPSPDVVNPDAGVYTPQIALNPITIDPETGIGQRGDEETEDSKLSGYYLVNNPTDETEVDIT